MRIGTWNLNRKLRPGGEGLLLGLDADVLLLTEAPPDLALPGYHLTPVGPLMALGQQWSTIASREPVESLASPHPSTTVAAVAGVVYACSVLPWGGAAGDPWRGNGYTERMLHALDDLAPFLCQQDRLVWGGDWNHALEGPLDGSTLRGRERIDLLLADLGLHAPTRHDPRGVYAINSIDHVAVTDEQAISTHIVAAVDSRRLSDHDAYVVDDMATSC